MIFVTANLVIVTLAHYKDAASESRKF